LNICLQVALERKNKRTLGTTFSSVCQKQPLDGVAESLLKLGENVVISWIQEEGSDGKDRSKGDAIAEMWPGKVVEVPSEISGH
jgi:hypothetical protein